MDEDRIETIENWSRDKKTKHGRLNDLFKVQQLLGFCNYYRRFIPKYSAIVEPLRSLTKKDESFQWESEQQCAFQTMVTAFTMVSELRDFDHVREVIIGTDASDYVSAAMLSQYNDEAVLSPVA